MKRKTNNAPYTVWPDGYMRATTKDPSMISFLVRNMSALLRFIERAHHYRRNYKIETVPAGWDVAVEYVGKDEDLWADFI